MPLAELNVARPRYALDDPRLGDFMAALDRVNALAERSDGFIWRLKGDGSNATDLTIPSEPDAIVNLSLWRDAAALEHFVWNTVHHRFYRRRDEWFDNYRNAYFVMWTVPDAHRPTVPEAFERLAHLRAHGSTDHAFGWEHLALTRWREGRCSGAS